MADHTDALSDSLMALSGFLVGDITLRDALLRVAELGQQAVGGADSIGVTLLDNGRPTTAVCTDATTLEFDSLQYELGDGPCLTAYRERKVVRIDSTTEETRWPEFVRRASEKGLRSSLSLPLIVEQRGIGALNLYGGTERAFSKEDEAIGFAFASQAAIVLANAQAYWGAFELSRQLDEALKSRATIEQAKGILMAQSGVSADEAFDLLRRASQRENRKLRDISADIVARTQQGREPEA